MSSGGMDWAYRMIASRKLDALGVAIVLHLGWRDNVNFRTDRAIARALGRSRAAVQAATAKLVVARVIERCPKGLVWLACETVALVRGDADGPEPDRDCLDASPAPTEGRPRDGAGPEVGPGGGPDRGPQKAPTEGHKRKRKEDKEPPASFSYVSMGRASPSLACSDGVGGSAVCTGSVSGADRSFEAWLKLPLAGKPGFSVWSASLGLASQDA